MKGIDVIINRMIFERSFLYDVNVQDIVVPQERG